MVRAALALVFLVAAGCEKEGSGGASGGASWPGATTAEVTRALEAVPEGAVGVAVLSMPKPFWSYLFEYTMVPMTGGEQTELDKDLRAVLGGQLGLDVTKARGAVGFLVLPAGGAAVFRDVSGKMKGASVDGIAPLEDQIVAGHRGTTMAIGLEPAVRAALDAGGGKVKNLTQSDPKLAAWMAEQGTGSWIFFAATPKSAPDLPQPLSQIDRFAVSLGPKRLRAVAEGDPAALQQIATQIDALIAQSMTEMSAMRAEAIKGELPVPIAAVGVFQYHQLKSMASHAKPKLSGNTLVMEVPIEMADSGMTTVALIGIAAAVAIPAFMKYKSKSKSVGPHTELMRIRAGVENHLMEHGALPPAAGPTPALGACCGSGGRCLPSPALWATETWRALRFSIDEPNSYSYELVTDAKSYTVRAFGDLDCDSVYSTFSLSSADQTIVETDPLE